MTNLPSRHHALMHMSLGLIERSHLAIDSTHARTERCKRLIPRSLDRIVWIRDLVGEHASAKAAVSSFVDVAKSNGLSAAETLALLREIVQRAQDEAGDNQFGGALEHAVMRWGTAACSR